MARIRTIKPEFWTDEDMSELSEPACLLAIGLLNYADDEGYFNANPKLIRAAIFPIREPSRSIPVLIQELSNCGYIAMYSTSDNKQFGHICNFARHQVVNKPRPSKIKGLELIPYESGSTTVELPLGMDQGSGIREGNETPHSAREEISKPSTQSVNAIIDNHVPPSSGSLVVGKFTMFEGWQPSPDFTRLSAVWGCRLDNPPTPEEIAGFVSYWQAEGKAFHQTQWEQKLSRNLVTIRAKKAREPESVPHWNSPEGWKEFI